MARPNCFLKAFRSSMLRQINRNHYWCSILGDGIDSNKYIKRILQSHSSLLIGLENQNKRGQ